MKEGASRDPKYDYGEEEELHVLITGERQEDVDKAVDMIERLLEPNDDTLNEHKRLQLRELAALNGTLKDETVRGGLATWGGGGRAVEVHRHWHWQRGASRTQNPSRQCRNIEGAIEGGLCKGVVMVMEKPGWAAVKAGSSAQSGDAAGFSPSIHLAIAHAPRLLPVHPLPAPLPQACYVCGDTSHRGFECPKQQAVEVYK